MLPPLSGTPCQSPGWRAAEMLALDGLTSVTLFSHTVGAGAPTLPIFQRRPSNPEPFISHTLPCSLRIL